MKNNFSLPILFTGAVIFFALTACGPSQADLDATSTRIQEEAYSKQTAEAPTNTPIPTDTPVPTDTPSPTETPIPTDTPTPTITSTSLPTDTPEPTGPSEPTLGELLFFDDEFESPYEEFKPGVTRVYACFEYWNMSPELRISGYVYFNGENLGSISGFYDLEGDDSDCFYIGDGKYQLDPGQYKVKLFIEKELATEGEFRILR